jgi:hypothetical protein
MMPINQSESSANQSTARSRLDVQDEPQDDDEKDDREQDESGLPGMGSSPTEAVAS